MRLPHQVALLCLLYPPGCWPMAFYHLEPSPHSARKNFSFSPPTLTIAKDPKGKLPELFSICFSFYQGLNTRVFSTQILEIRGDQAPKDPTQGDKGLFYRVWTKLQSSTLLNIGYVNTEEGSKSLMPIGTVVVEEWIHICTSVNAVTGDLLIVVNGDIAYNDKNKFLENSEDKMPTSAVNAIWFYGKATKNQKYAYTHSDIIFSLPRRRQDN